MPSLLSKYRNKKRESTADERSPTHRKGASDGSYDSSAQSPATTNSTRGLNSPFMGDEKRTSPPKGQKSSTHQQMHNLHQDLPNVPGRSPRTPTQPQNPAVSQAHQQQYRPPANQQGTPMQMGQHPQYHGGHPQAHQQGHPQGHPQGQVHMHPQRQSPPHSAPNSREPPQTPAQALPVKGDRIERFSPEDNRNDPWAEWQIRRACPSARFGHSANNIAARDGELLIMGGIREMDILDDLWIIDTNSLSGYQVKTEGPYVGPRVGHAALTLGNAYIMLGGDTKIKETDPLDDNLYLLNTSTFKWTVAEPTGPRPCGRYGHSICNLGVRIYVFGGQVDDLFFDDMWMFDLNNLRPPNARWERIEPVSPPPPPRTNHTVVTHEDKMYLFGGANGDLWYSDTWCFDSKTNLWTQLECTGYVPAPCQGHAATIVDDVMYVFGGMSSQGLLIGQLFALKLSTCKWYTFQNLGTGPSPRSGHSLTAFDGDKILVWGGTDQSNTAFVLDVSRISYPPDEEGDTPYDSRTDAISTHESEPVASQQAAVAETSTSKQVDTYEHSTPAARNSVIYSRTSWSPHRRSRLSQYESAVELQRQDDPNAVPQGVSEVDNEDTTANSYEYDRSDDFNASLQQNRLDRDRPGMPSVLSQDKAQPDLAHPSQVNESLPKGLPDKVPDTPTSASRDASNTSHPSTSPGGTLAGAVAGAAGAIGALGAGIFGGRSSADNSQDISKKSSDISDEMPGSWTHTRIDSGSDSDADADMTISSDVKSHHSARSNQSAEHASQHTIDRLNGYDNSYEDAFKGNYSKGQNGSFGQTFDTLESPTNARFDQLDDRQTPISYASSEYPEGTNPTQPTQVHGNNSQTSGHYPADSTTHILNEVASGKNSVNDISAATPFEVQTSSSSGGFHSPEQLKSSSKPFSGETTTAAGAIAAGVAGLSVARARNAPGDSSNKVSDSTFVSSNVATSGPELTSHLPESAPISSSRSAALSESTPLGSPNIAKAQPLEGASGSAADLATLKKLESEFSAVKRSMQEQAQEASARIRQVEAERDDALRKLEASGPTSSGDTRDISSDSQAIDAAKEEYRQKHAASQRDLFDTEEKYQDLMYQHEKLKARHEDANGNFDYLQSTMEQHVNALDAVNQALEHSRVTAHNAQLEADALRQENSELKHKLAQLQQEVDENSGHAARANQLETQVSGLRDAHESANTALNQHLTQIVNHWSAYNERATNKSADRSIPSENDHYAAMYEKQKEAHLNTQRDLDAAHEQLSQLREQAQAQPNVEALQSSHSQELAKLRGDHETKISQIMADHEANVRGIHSKYQGESSTLEKQYEELEHDYSSALDHFKSQRLALDKTRDELNRVKEVNSKLEEELQDVKLQLQDPDASTASTTSNRHAEVMVRGLKARIIILEEERDELRQKVEKLKEAALAASF